MDYRKFVQARKDHLDHGCKSPMFQDLVGGLDHVYRAVVERAAPSSSPGLGRLALICHRSMLSAGTLIAQCQPDDSVGITRRAVEAAKFALAVQLDKNNADEWASFAERRERWAKRQQYQKPKPLRVRYDGLSGDPTAEELDDFLGILSDAYVHFTPEYCSSLDWVEKHAPDGQVILLLNYFHQDAREVERNLLLLGAVHKVILQVFDRCLDGFISKDSETLAAMNKFLKVGKWHSDEFQKRYGVTPDIAI